MEEKRGFEMVKVRVFDAIFYTENSILFLYVPLSRLFTYLISL